MKGVIILLLWAGVTLAQTPGRFFDTTSTSGMKSISRDTSRSGQLGWLPVEVMNSTSATVTFPDSIKTYTNDSNPVKVYGSDTTNIYQLKAIVKRLNDSLKTFTRITNTSLAVTKSGTWSDTTNKYLAVALYNLLNVTKRVYVRDATFANTKDTSSYDFAFNYYMGYIDIYNPNASADSFAVEMNNPTKNDWSANAFGLKNVLTGVRESNNAVVIVPASTTYRYEIQHKRPGATRVRDLSSKTRASNVVIGFTGIN